jgi:hypothetical protein
MSPISALGTVAVLAAFGCHAGFAFTAWARDTSLGYPDGPPEKFCAGYANAAVSQVDRAVKARCGFTGARWTADKELHRKWCLGLNGDQTFPYSEYHARDAEIEDCFAWCSNYGNLAVAAAGENQQLRCDYTGPRWSPEKDDHSIWCQFTGTQAHANAETAARTAALKDCRAKAVERIVPNSPKGARDILKEPTIIDERKPKDLGLPCPPNCKYKPDVLIRPPQ